MGIDDSKGMLRSKTILGALVALSPALDQAIVATGISDVPVFGPIAGCLTTILGSVFSIFGRIQAVSNIRGIF